MRRVLLGESHVTLAVRMASVRPCSAHSGVHLQGVCLPLFLHICNAARPVCALQPPRQQVDMQRQSFPSGTSLLCTAVQEQRQPLAQELAGNCSPVVQVSWAKGGELVAFSGAACRQLLSCHQACSSEAEADHQAAVHCAGADWPAGALPLLHV